MHQQTCQLWQGGKTQDSQGHTEETDHGASQTEQHKGNKDRDWLQKTRELVGKGEWINKTVLSASPRPAGSFKWVDVDRWVSPFFPSSSPPFHFSLCLSLSSIWQIPPLPLPLPCYTLYWNGLSPTHKPTPACTSIPHPLSNVLFTVRLRPTAL